jgi:hypothetical protein
MRIAKHIPADQTTGNMYEMRFMGAGSSISRTREHCSGSAAVFIMYTLNRMVQVAQCLQALHELLAAAAIAHHHHHGSHKSQHSGAAAAARHQMRMS